MGDVESDEKRQNKRIFQNLICIYNASEGRQKKNCDWFFFPFSVVLINKYRKRHSSLGWQKDNRCWIGDFGRKIVFFLPQEVFKFRAHCHFRQTCFTRWNCEFKYFCLFSFIDAYGFLYTYTAPNPFSMHFIHQMRQRNDFSDELKRRENMEIAPFI